MLQGGPVQAQPAEPRISSLRIHFGAGKGASMSDPGTQSADLPAQVL